MIFLKHFDTARQSLLGICKIYAPRTSKVRDLIPIQTQSNSMTSCGIGESNLTKESNPTGPSHVATV